jgi:lipopolysaccharide/colanic/teichoic acid biosynthesis glycosyltransferase
MKQELRELNEAGSGLFKIAADPRITRIGRQLRSTHLDELPQLINVLRGEMSLVGPRPLVAEEDSLFTGRDRHRLRLTPGMTGPWQVKGPMNAPISEMAMLDYRYASNWSIWQDVDILLKTALRVVDRAGH